MASVNRVVLIGNLGRDPVIRRSPEGQPVANLNIATNEFWKDKATGEKKQRTEWHRIVCFGRLAEIVEEYVKQGHPVYIEGRQRTRKWQDKEGKDRYTTEVVALNIQMLNGKGKGEDASAAPKADDGDLQSLLQEADNQPDVD